MFPCSHVPRDFSEIAASPRRLAVIAADSILQREGETISRRHERGCVRNGSGRAYRGVARDSVCLIEAGEPITAARVIRYLSCHEDRLYHGGKRASMSIVAASLAAGESLMPPRGSLPYCHDRNRVFRAFVTESLLLSYHIESLSCCRDCHHLPFHDRLCRHDRAFSASTKESLLAPSLKSHSYTSIP